MIYTPDILLVNRKLLSGSNGRLDRARPERIRRGNMGKTCQSISLQIQEVIAWVLDAIIICMG